MSKLFYYNLLLIRDAFYTKKKILKLAYHKDTYNFLTLLTTLGYLNFINVYSNFIYIDFKVSEKEIFEVSRIFNYNYQISDSYLLHNYPVAFSHLTIKSKPAKKIYLNWKYLYHTKSISEIRILNTDKGFLTCSDCIKNKVGGIYICSIWH